MPRPSNCKRAATTCVLILTTIVVGALIPIGNHSSQKAPTAEWAGQNGYLAVEIREAGIFEASTFLLNNEHDNIFRAELEDASHQRRTSWFRFRLLGIEQAWKD